MHEHLNEENLNEAFDEDDKAEILSQSESEKEKDFLADEISLDGEEGKKAEENTQPYLSVDEKAEKTEKSEDTEDAREFLRLYPEAAARLVSGEYDIIPDEVWEKLQNGESLVSAYREHETKSRLMEQEIMINRLKAELTEAKRKNEKIIRTTGSQNSDSSAKSPDAFDLGWGAF